MKESYNRIYVLHLPPCINDPVCRKSAEKLLSAEKRRRLELFTCKPEHDRTLFGDLLVRTVLAKHTGIAPDQLCFDKGQFGKPVLRSAPFCFNLSHSGDYAVCAVSDAECGADIEQPRPVRRDFAARFFHPDETAFLQTCPADSYPIFLCRLWTLKEAYLKYLGIGLRRTASDFSFINKTHSFFTHDFAPELFFFHMQLQDQSALSVCGAEPFQAPEYISPQQLVRC